MIGGTCAACGLRGHRYGTTDPEHEYSATACINGLLHKVEQREAECYAWMNGVADFVEPLGFNREAACGPADLLPGLGFMRDRIVDLLNALDYRAETGDADPYYAARHDLVMALGGDVRRIDSATDSHGGDHA